MAGQALALGIELDEAFGHVFGGLFGTAFGFFPFRAAQFRQALAAGVVAAADVFGDEVQLEGGDIENVCPGELELDVIPRGTVHGHLYHADEAADAVVVVDHEIAGGEVGEGL